VLRLFRQNTILSGVLLFLLCFVLKLPSIIQLRPYEYIQTAPLARIVFPFMSEMNNHLFWSYIICAILIFLQALLINFIVTQHGILYKDTLLPALFFVILNSFYPQQAELTPQLISNTFIIFLFQRLCFLYESQNPLLIVFDTGMYLGLGILFNYDLSIFLPFILISVVVFTSFNVRYLIISLIGIAVPLYFTAIAFYMNGNFNELIFYVKQSFEKQLLKTFNGAFTQFIPWIILSPIILISGFELQQNYFRNKVKTRRIIQSVGLMLLFGVFSLFIENTNFIYAICYLSVPMCIIVAYFFISEKRFLLKETIVLALIAISFYYQLK
jgi:hypothetical protein